MQTVYDLIENYDKLRGEMKSEGNELPDGIAACELIALITRQSIQVLQDYCDQLEEEKRQLSVRLINEMEGGNE